jgi:hypothetical protein
VKHLFFILIFSLCICACRNTGTDTGNPATDTGNPEVTRGNPLTDSFATRATMSLCGSLAVCYSNLDVTNCETAMLTTPGIPNAFGFSAHSTLNDVTTDTDASYSDANFNTCLDTIDNLPCSSFTFTNAYSDSNPTNFDNTYLLLESSTLCAQTNDPSGISANPPSVTEGTLNNGR